MKTLVILGICILVTVSAFAAEPDPIASSEKVQPSADEQAVILALLTSTHFTWRPLFDPFPQEVLLRSLIDTGSAHTGGDFLKAAKDPEMVKAFQTANAKTAEWAPQNKLPTLVRWVDSAAIRALLAEGGWPRVQQEFPKAGSLVSISRVGFSADHQRALVGYSTGVIGPLSGGGKVLLMQKTKDGWSVEDTIVSFVH